MLKYRFMVAAGMFAFGALPAMAAMSAADREFARKAAEGGLAEVSMGQLAEQNAASPQVKEFGQRMVIDHSKVNRELQQIAQEKGLTIPTEPDSKDQATQRRLSTLQGAAFDSAYTRDMIRDHQQDIADFRKEAESGQDPDLKAFAQRTLPILEQHLQMAEADKGKS